MAALEFTGERYLPSEGGQIKLEHLHRYAACRELVVGRVVLDIACGEGYGSSLLANWASDVFGVDVDAAAIAHARARYGGYGRNLSFVHGDCAAIPLPDQSVDVVVSFETIEHHDRHTEMMAEIKRVLRSGGLLVISSPNKLAYSDVPGYRNPFHVKELYYDELKALLACFRNVRFYGQKVGLGSFLVPLDQSPAVLKAVACEGEGINIGASLAGLPVYYFCLCSDAELPSHTLVASVLTERAEDAYQALVDGYRGQEEMATQRALALDAQALRAATETARAEQLSQALDAATAKSDRLESDLRTERERVIREQAHAEQLSQALDAATAKSDRLESDLRTERERVIREQAHADQLSQSVEAIRDSTSWRVTAPMRAVIRGARAVRGSAGRLIRSTYHRLPVSDEAKRTLKSGVYSAFGFFLRGSKSYQHWKRFRTPPGFHALVVDDRTPALDRDAGSLRVVHVIKILQLLGYDVTFIPFDLTRVDQDTEYLESLGVRCLTNPDVPSVEAHLVAEGSRYSLIYSSRPDPTAALLPLYRQYAPIAKVVYDTQDLHFVRERRFAELSGDRSLLDAASWRKQQELALAQAADCTLVVSGVEREILERESPDARVQVIPLMHDSFASPAGFSERCDLVFLGGYQHRPNVDAVQYFVESILPLVRPRLPGVRFYIVGSNSPPEIHSLACDDVIVTGQIPDLTHIMNGCRVAVNPLRYGAGVKGKILTAMSYGLPSVGTTIAAEGMMLRSEEDFLIADDPQLFADAVVRLYTDEALWTRLSMNGRAVIEDRFSISVGTRGLEALHAALGLPLPKRYPATADCRDPIHTPGEGPQLEIESVRSLDAYRRRVERDVVAHQMRAAFERALAVPFRAEFDVEGLCNICGRSQPFRVDHEFGFTFCDGTRMPNWRERLVCPSCHLNCRMRASIHVWRDLFHPTLDDRIYLTEQRTALFAWFVKCFPCATGSEFLGNALPLGASNRESVRNESLTRLTFPDCSFDHILSFDVLEHIPEYGNALREVYRCLAPNGVFFFSVPFDLSSEAHIVRARVAADGTVVHILPPEYHGDPLNSAGCLCFYHFGWRLLGELRECGFVDTVAHLTWSREFSYLGGDQVFFSARRPD